MPDLTVWIEAQLKRGHTKEEIKQYLASKGYSQAVAAKVDNAIVDDNAQVDKMKPSSLSNQSRRAISMPKGLGLVLPIVAVGVVAVLLLFLTDSFTSSKQQEKAGEEPVAAETAEPASELCKEFSEAKTAVSCGEAVSLALEKEPGAVRKISVGTVPVLDASVSPPVPSTERAWLIDVELSNPRFDEVFNKEVRLLRVGIGTDKDTGVYREPLN